MNQKIHIITSEKNWMESLAVSQLQTVANLPGAVRTVGLPDLHAGKSPVGMALITEGVIYPHLIGNDIGCGMGLFDTGVALSKFSEKRWVSRLNHIRELGDIETVNPYAESSPIAYLGTIGGGNHFAEFQQLEEIYSPDDFEGLNPAAGNIFLLVHSGSRGYGHEIFRAFGCEDGLAERSQSAAEYLERHENALLWARRNRALVAQKLIDWLGYGAEPVKLIDLVHNYLEKRGDTWVHRKGAVSSEEGLVVLPGSRGSLTYVVKPTGDRDKSAWSLSHGAGRKWARSLCKSRIKDKYDHDSIRQTKLKSKVVCHDTELLFQEAPEAYKNIEHILTALSEHGLITLVATLRPIVTYKG